METMTGRLGLRTRLVLLVLFASLPAFAVAYHVAQEARQETAEFLQRDSLRLAHKVAAEQDSVVESTRQLLTALAAVPEVRWGTGCQSVLQSVVASPIYNWMAVLDSRGVAVCGAPESAVRHGGEDWFREAVRTGSFTLSGFQMGRVAGSPVAIAALPILDDAGVSSRVLTASIDLGWLGRRLAEAEHPEASITIVDQQGTVLARHPEAAAWVGRSLADHPAVAAALTRGDGTMLARGLMQDQRAYGFTRLGSTEAHVIAGLPMDRAWLEADAIYFRTLAHLTGIGVIVLLLALFAAQRLVVRPVAALAAAAGRLSRGDLHARSGLPAGGDEVGELAARFDSMAAAVEEMVQARTEELRESEARFRLALRSTRVVVFSQDQGLRYTWIHGPGRAFAPERWLGRSDDELFAPEDAGILAAFKRRVMETGVGAREFLALRGEGDPKVYDALVEPLRDRAGVVVGVMGSAIDVTEERRRQGEFEAARAAAENADRAKTQFLAAASHDLRQPLQALSLYMHLLNGKLETPEQRSLADLVTQSSEAACRLVDTLMGLSALETGQVQPRVASVAVGPLLCRIAEEARGEAADKGLDIRVRVAGMIVDTDPVLLERMVRNLVKNALRYTERGSILIAGRRDGDGCRVEVWDTGPGIPAEKLQVIFEDFYQLPGARRPGEHGLGLGLSTVARMGRLLGHEIGVRSRVGRGSKFFIRLPRGSASLAA